MAIPNMATITASLERSLQNCSLNHHQHGGEAAAHGSDEPLDATTPSLELNSHVSLPYHWEQCLDLKTGEIYYINWRTGMKSKEDPRQTAEENGGGDDFYEEEEDDDDVSSYDSEGSSTESSPYNYREQQWSDNSNNNNINQEINCYNHQEKNDDENNIHHKCSANQQNNNVLVVAGCKGCFMYYMVPKQHEICPKCCGQLIHFDRSAQNGSS